jgi:serine phosphatase RsbU (regulator of sigma subunit)/catechol 2,3-dioxygenase-like lactoylglutathione lyase family enzyme
MSSFPSLEGLDRFAFRPDRQDPYLRVFKSTVFVRDHDQSLRFYVDQLGFSVVADVGFDSSDRWLAVAPPDGSAFLALVSPKPGSEDYKLIGRSTQVAFITEDVNATYEQWCKRGVRFHSPPHTTLWGGMFARFEDVDGNSFELLGTDEMSRQIEAQRCAIAEKLESERRASQELEIAKQVQARLFPQSLPPLRTLDYAGTCIQARQVGGDYFDFLELRLGRLALVLADIAGKGLSGALLMASLQANLRAQCATLAAFKELFPFALEDFAQLLVSVNRLFCQNTGDGIYATLFFADYDDASRRLSYVNCGHLPALLMHDSQSSSETGGDPFPLGHLHSTSTVMGLFDSWGCHFVQTQLAPGDILLMYTDGVTEATNATGEEFGEQRLIEALRRHRELPSQALLASIVADVRQFSPHEQHDDITLIVAKCRY